MPSEGSNGRKLVGYDNFVRHNPMSDKFDVKEFHHVEFWTSDASNTAGRFQWGLGMNKIAKSDQGTGNHTYASYVLQTGKVVFAFSAPYGLEAPVIESEKPHPAFDAQFAHSFIAKHGMAVRAVGISVSDAADAYHTCVKNGGVGVLEPTELTDKASGKKMVISEVKLYGDVVLRWVSGDFDGPFLPNYESVSGPDLSLGIERLDHAVGNVPKLLEQVDYMINMTGFHEFAEFTAEDVGTVDSGLNSMVLANNAETVLLPINEPTYGTKRKSQIQTYLEQNCGAGLQHLALKTDDIFHTVREMRKRSYCGGFDFMPKASDEYYKKLPAKIGDILTEEQYKQVEELGILVDKDDQGVLIQVFTKPLGDRPTVFIEIIQRVGCMFEKGGKMEQKPACGGFGKGNFSELFKSIEDYEKEMGLNE